MCVIVAKDRGVALPENDTLHECFNHNNDGAGFAYARGGRVHIRKGFMTWRKFKKGLRRERLEDRDSIIYHFRIGTSGTTRPHNTHPFPMSSSEKLLRATWVSTNCAIAHNGVISYFGEDD